MLVSTKCVKIEWRKLTTRETVWHFHQSQPWIGMKLILCSCLSVRLLHVFLFSSSSSFLSLSLTFSPIDSCDVMNGRSQFKLCPSIWLNNFVLWLKKRNKKNRGPYYSTRCVLFDLVLTSWCMCVRTFSLRICYFVYLIRSLFGFLTYYICRCYFTYTQIVHIHRLFAST